MWHADILRKKPKAQSYYTDPPCWLNSVPPRAMRDAAPWVLAHDSPPLQHVHGPIALLVSGAWQQCPAHRRAVAPKACRGAIVPPHSDRRQSSLSQMLAPSPSLTITCPGHSF